jgi:putative nucleotidyltransferase with HDIG domain
MKDPQAAKKPYSLKKTAHSSFQFKIIVILFSVFSATTLGSSYLLEKNIKRIHIKVVKDELRSIAAIAAIQIDGDLVEQLQRPEQEKSVQYQLLQKQLLRMMQNKKIDDVYIMRKSAHPNQLTFVINAYVAGKDHVALGETYELAQAPDMLQGFVRPTVDREITTDKWGQMLSGYAPVKNSRGAVVGMLGIDYTANEIRNEYQKSNKYVVAQVISGMLIMLFICLFLTKKVVKRLNNIATAVDSLLEEKSNTLIDDTGNDEIRALASRVNELIKKIITDKEQMLIQSISCLVNALEARDEYTHGHSSRVAAITNDIMQELQVESEQQFIINFAAVLHDIGKIGIPDSLLHKPGKLTGDEYTVIKRHSTIGEKILEGIPALEEIRDIVRHHHEWYDGNGYPDRLSGLQIHQGARIIAVADSFQAMISDRPYRKGMKQAVAMRELERNKGIQFDPVIVEAFLAICKNKTYKESKK